MNINNYTRNNDKAEGITNAEGKRVGKGLNGLYIPESKNHGQITYADNLYPVGSVW